MLTLHPFRLAAASSGRSWVFLLLAIMLLAGCGGGSDVGQPEILPPIAAKSAQSQCPIGQSLLLNGTCEVATPARLPEQRAAAAVAALTPGQLMDWAEREYPELFPLTGRTSGYLAPYTYRHYPKTNNYIGVSTGASAIDVYLYGSASGWQLLRVGALSDFTCLVTPLACAVRTLSISQFGQGTILASDSLPVCVGQDCSREYPYGTMVSMTATPAAGWKFRYWSGCDAGTGNKCDVTLTVDKTAHPVFERTTPVVLKPDAVLLTATTMSRLISNQGGVLIFKNTATQVKTLAVGKVIYSVTGQGLLRRVTNIIALSGGNIIVDTTDATLQDLIAEGTLILDGRAGAASVSPTNSPDGAEQTTDFRFIPDISVSFDVLLVNPGPTKEGFSAKAKLDLQPEVAIDFDLLGLTQFKVVANPKITLNEIQVRLKESDILIGPKTFGPQLTFPPVAIGPVVLTPTASMTWHLKTTIKVGVELNGQLSAGGSFGIRWLRDDGWRTIGNANFSGNYLSTSAPIKVVATGELDFFAGLVSGLKFYGTAGPSIEAGLFVNGKFSDTMSADEICYRLALKAGLRAKAIADAKIPIINWELARYEATFLEISWPYPDLTALKCEDKNKPSKVTGGVAKGVAPTQMDVGWQPATDNVGVVNYEVKRGGKLITPQASTTFIDLGLQPDTEYCYTIAALDKAGNRGLESDAFCGRTPAKDTQPPGVPSALTGTPLSTTAIRLDWIPGADSSDVKDYIIYLNGRQVGHSSDGKLEYTVTKLKPNTQYCFSVAAVDPSGNMGARTTETCVTTKSGAAWTMKIRCDQQSTYVVENDVDLDVNNDQSVNVVGSGNDYTGQGLAYQLYGTYAAAQTTLTGQISWTFANDSSVRVDEYTVNVGTGDTGDVRMNQVQVTGCTTFIRFLRKSTTSAPLAAPKDTFNPTTSGGGSISGR